MVLNYRQFEMLRDAERAPGNTEKEYQVSQKLRNELLLEIDRSKWSTLLFLMSDQTSLSVFFPSVTDLVFYLQEKRGALSRD